MHTLHGSTELVLLPREDAIEIELEISQPMFRILDDLMAVPDAVQSAVGEHAMTLVEASVGRTIRKDNWISGPSLDVTARKTGPDDTVDSISLATSTPNPFELMA